MLPQFKARCVCTPETFQNHNLNFAELSTDIFSADSIQVCTACFLLLNFSLTELKQLYRYRLNKVTCYMYDLNNVGRCGKLGAVVGKKAWGGGYIPGPYVKKEAGV